MSVLGDHQSTEGGPDLVVRMYRDADRVMVVVLWLLWGVSFGFAALYSTWLLWGVVASGITLGGTFLAKVKPGTLTTRLGMGVAFMMYSAFLIHQAHGATETHFGIFTLLAFLLYYRDWRPVVLAAAVIAIHHAGFYLLQTEGVPVYVFEHAHMPIMVVVHAAYVVFETVVLAVMAMKLQREAVQAATLASLGERSVHAEGIDLDSSRFEDAGAAGQGVAGFLQTISDALQEAATVAASIRRSSADLSAASGHMVEIRDHQHAEVNRAVQLVHEMDSIAGEIAENSKQIAEDAEKSAHNAGETELAMTSAREAIEHMVESVEENSTEMARLEAATGQIENIVTMINRIAGQTNLLALNASIEAARAGDAGRGFAVVAQEVRRLSESTQSSAKEIQTVVEGLRIAALNAQQVADQSRSEAQRGGEQLRSAVEAFQVVVARLPEFSREMHTLSESMNRQQQMMRMVTGNMSEVAGDLDRSSKRIEDLDANGKSLSSMSERLYASVRRFRRGKEVLIG